uniref:Uncharacterized protein n=1 Tax=Podarcis muralis TaxID=64176 RepID=A0A670IYI4_PODMU
MTTSPKAHCGRAPNRSPSSASFTQARQPARLPFAKMADDSDTAVRRPSGEEENDQQHCSDCENEDEHNCNRGGLSPADDSGGKKKKKKQKRKKEKSDQVDSAQDQTVKVTLPAERMQEIQKAIELFSVGQGPARQWKKPPKRSYQFWTHSQSLN